MDFAGLGNFLAAYLARDNEMKVELCVASSWIAVNRSMIALHDQSLASTGVSAQLGSWAPRCVRVSELTLRPVHVLPPPTPHLAGQEAFGRSDASRGNACACNLAHCGSSSIEQIARTMSRL